MSFFICGKKPFIPNTSLGILLFSNCNRHKQLFSEMFPKFYWNLSKWLQRFFRGFPEIFRSAIVQNTSERQFLNMNNCLKIPELWKIPEDTLLKLARLDLFFHNSSCGSISANVVINFWMLVVNGFTAIFSSCINNFCWFYMLILEKGMLNFCMDWFLRIGSNYSRIQVFVNANFLFFCNKKLAVSKLKWNKHVAYGPPCFITCGMLEERSI